VGAWRVNRESGQAALLLVGALGFVLVGALILGAIAAGVGVQGRDQRAADLAALAGARAMRSAYPGLFEPAAVAGQPISGHDRPAEKRLHTRGPHRPMPHPALPPQALLALRARATAPW
jgi:hypothetical protein